MKFKRHYSRVNFDNLPITTINLPIMMQDTKSYLKTIALIPKNETLCLNLKIRFETLKLRLENPKPISPNLNLTFKP